MTLLRRLARPLLASMFISGGYGSVRHPEYVAGMAKSVVEPLAAKVSFVPDETEKAVRISGATQVVAGSFLAIGRFPRLSALALAGTLVPTTWAAHRFWEHEDAAERSHQRVHFYKNLSMMGGLLLAAADTDGRPSLGWRASHGARIARREAKLAGKLARANAGTTVVRTAGKAAVARQAAKSAGKLARANAGAKVAKSAGKAGATTKIVKSAGASARRLATHS